MIISAYNIEKYIGKCIDCVINQTYKNLEIIIVDDGSTDKTSQICGLFAKKDERIKVLHKANGGPSSARNAGIEASTGQYLFFVDGDDLVHLECIERLKGIMDTEEYDIVQGKTYAFLNEDKIPYDLPEPKVEVYTGRKMCEHLLFGTYGSDATVVWDKLYKRTVFDQLRFAEGMLYEDVAIMHEIFWDAGRVAVTNQPLSFYRSMREGSITHSGNKRYEDQVKADLMQLSFFEGKKDEKLLGQCYYVLANDIARLRIYKKDYNNKIKNRHKTAVKRANRLKIGVAKKTLVNLGYISPHLWYVIWKARRELKGRIEWWKKGEKK